MLLKMCAKCKKSIVYPLTYCEKCQAIVDEARKERQLLKQKQWKKESNKRYDEKRDKKLVQFYNSKAWRQLSAKVLQDNGYRCKECGTIATQVHHTNEITTPYGWEQRYSIEQLVALCNTCHNDMHHRFEKSRKKIKK